MDIDSTVFAILDQGERIVGSGFLVSAEYGVTCAHVIHDAGAIAGDVVQVRFFGQKDRVEAQVVLQFWSEPEEFDVAILKLERIPAGVRPLRLERASTCHVGGKLYTFGYARAADETYLSGHGEFTNFPTSSKVFQFRMHEVNHGHSGAPLLDLQRHAIIGMIQKGETQLGRNAETTFAIPVEIIRQVCPLIPAPLIAPNRAPLVEGIHLLPDDSAQRIQNFLKVYLGDKDHPVPFGGRDAALRTLDDWLAGTTPYLLLAAPAGRGKSALLVRWLDGLQARGGVALAFVPVSIRFGTNLEHAFYAALAARLAFLHGDKVTDSPETSTTVYRGLVARYLAQPLPDGRPLLVVLDGLDEAGDWQAGADFLPSELPARVRVAVSARYLAGDADAIPWLRRLNWERSGLAAAPSLDPLDKPGVADVLVKMGCPLDELGRQVDIVAELHRLSTGDPLLVGLYVGDLWGRSAGGIPSPPGRGQGEGSSPEEKDPHPGPLPAPLREREARGEGIRTTPQVPKSLPVGVTGLKPEDLASIRPGYAGYFERWWEEQKRLWGKEKPWLERHVRAVRSLLAGALGPLGREDFCALEAGLEADYIADALDVLRRFIIGDGQGYIFSHPKLGQYFWEALTVPEQAQWEGRFLAWGERVLQELVEGRRDPRKKGEVPGYVVRNYGAHLARAKRPIKEWLPLVHHREWAQAWFTVEGAYGGYSRDVQRVWEVCKTLDREAVEKVEKAPYLGEQIRCGLIEASLHSLAGNISSELIPVLVQEEIWTLPQAWVFIRQMPEERQQAEAIIALIPVLEDSQLLEALEAARAIRDNRWRVTVLGALTQRVPQVTEEALKTVRLVHDHWDQVRALNALAQYLPQEMLGQVLNMVKEVQSSRNHVEILCILALRLPEKSLGQILEAVWKIQSNEGRAEVLSVLAQRMPDLAGHALRIARTIPDNKHRAEVLGYLSQIMAGATEESLKAMRMIQYEWERSETLSVLAQRLPEEALVQVIEAARVIQEDKLRAQVFVSLAHRLPEMIKKALEAIHMIQDEGYRAQTLIPLIHSLPKGELHQVLDIAWGVQNDRWRAFVLSALAYRLPTVAKDALEASQIINDEDAYAFALSNLARQLPQESLDQIFKAAQLLHTNQNRAHVLDFLTYRQPGLVEEILGVNQANSGYRLTSAQPLSQCVTIERMIRQVLATIWSIQYKEDRNEILSILSQPLSDLSISKCYPSIEIAIHHLSIHTRSNIFFGIAALLPIFFHINGVGIGVEILHAILDVVTWWE